MRSSGKYFIMVLLLAGGLYGIGMIDHQPAPQEPDPLLVATMGQPLLNDASDPSIARLLAEGKLQGEVMTHLHPGDRWSHPLTINLDESWSPDDSTTRGAIKIQNDWQQYGVELSVRDLQQDHETLQLTIDLSLPDDLMNRINWSSRIGTIKVAKGYQGPGFEVGLVTMPRSGEVVLALDRDPRWGQE